MIFRWSSRRSTQPLHAAAPALLLGRGRLLHSRGLGLLSHRLADSHHHADQRPSAAAQHLPGAVVEGFRLLSRGDARGGADGRGAGPAGGVAAGHAPGGRGLGRLLDRGRSPGFTPSGLRRARWPTPISLPPPARCGDWSTRFPMATASRGPRRCGLPPPRCRRRRPSPFR
jgi:hypothetical protein